MTESKSCSGRGNESPGRDSWPRPLLRLGSSIVDARSLFSHHRPIRRRSKVEMRTATETASQTTYVEPFVSTFRTESPVVSRLRRYQRDIRGRLGDA